jgi:hypothetical protein
VWFLRSLFSKIRCNKAVTGYRTPKGYFTILAGLILVSVGSASSLGNNTTNKSCREHPQLVGRCFSVHGRLSVFNGAPSFRIWKIGTKRVLGVSEQRFALEGYNNLPDDLRGKVDAEKDLYGDFLVCPFTKARPKEMQMVCIEQVTNVVIKNR